MSALAGVPGYCECCCLSIPQSKTCICLFLAVHVIAVCVRVHVYVCVVAFLPEKDTEVDFDWKLLISLRTWSRLVSFKGSRLPGGLNGTQFYSGTSASLQAPLHVCSSRVHELLCCLNRKCSDLATRTHTSC